MRDLLLKYVDEGIRAMRRAPAMWGSPESLELQALQLLELRTLVLRPQTFQRNHRETMRVYRDFVAQAMKVEPSRLLASLLEERGIVEELPTMIAQLYAELQARLPEEDPFESADLVLEMALESGKEPSFSSVCSYYEHFQKALRGIARHSVKKKERALVTQATEYAIPEMRVIHDKAGARMQVSLVQPTGQQLMLDGSSFAENAVRDAVTHAMHVATWADEEQAPETLHVLFPHEAQRKVITAQTMRMLPEQGIQEIRVGGRLLGGSEPISLKPHQAPRLIPVLKEGEKPKRFDRTGTVRAVDLDQKWFRIRYGSTTIKCWAPEHPEWLQKAADAMASKQMVRVVGDEFRAPSRRPFVETMDLQAA
ncbi:hypothetical protein WME95_43855 [Sorangium sp. So ce327]|uniref:hypothetical protein n=1 Tax=Sorangium sp. So ce327 TaxID=3133301 RepID=UPI003F5DBF64